MKTIIKTSPAVQNAFAILAIFALVFSTFAMAVPKASADHDPYGGVEMKKIILCHDEGGDSEGYHSSGGVSVNSVLNGGHGNHETDIIPPFHYDDGTYPGQNWNEVNEDIWNLGACDGDGELPVDVCPNLEGEQTTVPNGYELDEGGNCVLIGDPVDVCPNLDGDQSSVPDGYIVNEVGDCVIPVDVCPNLDGDQETLPDGYVYDDENNCVVADAECSITVISDENDVVTGDSDGVAEILSVINGGWTAITDAFWIWGDNPVNAPTDVDETQTFTKTFTWNASEASISGAILEIAADNGFKITLNSDVVSDQLGDEFNYGASELFEVSGSIQEGSNTLTVEVVNMAEENSDPSSNPAGLIYKLLVEGTDSDCDDVPVEDNTTITINKVTNVESSQTFDFYLDDAEVAIANLAGGESSTFEVEPGSHSITEDIVDGWTLDQDSSSCVNEEEEEVGGFDGNPYYLSLEEGDDITCTFYNNTPSETIEMCKFDENENPVSGWGMTLSNDTEGGTYNLVTGENGCVSQAVNPDDGPWHVTEETRDGWDFIDASATNGSVIDVQGTPTCEFFAPIISDEIFSLVALDIVIDETPEYSCAFYNDEDEDGGGGGGGGGGSRISLSDDDDDEDEDDEPTPQVLGEATSVVPAGAPATGAGGSAPVTVTLPSLLAIFASTRGVQKTR